MASVKPKTVDTRAGRLGLAVPQVRDSSFYPSAPERGGALRARAQIRDRGDVHVLVAVGIRPDGHRQVLGCSTALSEQETHWRGFLESLAERGPHGIELLVSDAHSGLTAALKAVLSSVPWQRCQFHLQQNAQSYVPRKDQRREVARAIRAIFDAPNRTEAEPAAEDDRRGP